MRKTPPTHNSSLPQRLPTHQKAHAQEALRQAANRYGSAAKKYAQHKANALKNTTETGHEKRQGV
jgi:hypothetical protein